MSPLSFPPKGAAWRNNGYIATSISNDGEDLEHLDVEYVGLMPVAPANPSGGLVAPTAVALASCAVSKAATTQRFFAPEGGPDYALWTAQDFVLHSH